MQFYKLENNIIKNMNIKEDSEVFALEKENTIIGYGIIDKKNINELEIFIKEEYRSNGYGKLLFAKMLEELKKQNYKEVKLAFSRNNYRIKSIIINFGGLQIHTNANEETYIVPIK